MCVPVFLVSLCVVRHSCSSEGGETAHGSSSRMVSGEQCRLADLTCFRSSPCDWRSRVFPILLQRLIYLYMIRDFGYSRAGCSRGYNRSHWRQVSMDYQKHISHIISYHGGLMSFVHVVGKSSHDAADSTFAVGWISSLLWNQAILCPFTRISRVLN